MQRSHESMQLSGGFVACSAVFRCLNLVSHLKYLYFLWFIFEITRLGYKGSLTEVFQYF